MAQYLDDAAKNDATSYVDSATNDGPANVGNPIPSIHVIFRPYQDGIYHHLIIECKLDEKASDIIEKYRNKSGDRDHENIFVFNSKRINQNLTLKENGIMNNSNIFVIKPHVEYSS